MSFMSTKRARKLLADANKDEYREIVLASGVWDAHVEAILDRYILPSHSQPQLTYRAIRRKVSWQYQLNCYGRFFLSAPTLWQAVRYYRAWRKHLVSQAMDDLQRNSFAGVDAWLNRGRDLADRQFDLRRAQVDALKSHFAALLAEVSAYEQLRIKCALVVVCRSQARGPFGGQQLSVTDVIGPGGLGPIRPIAE